MHFSFELSLERSQIIRSFATPKSVCNFLTMTKERARLQAVQAKHLDRLLAWPNVTAVDINKRTVGGKQTDQLCLVVWVRTKKPESEIAVEEVLPKDIDGVPVDVYEGEATLGEEFSWPTFSSAEEKTGS